LKLKVPKPETPTGRVVELVVIAVSALAVALACQNWVVAAYKIPSGSMEPTLDIGQRVLANRFVYHFEDPAIGDIIVFHPPSGAENHGTECGAPHPPTEACPRPTSQPLGEYFIKRIVAGPKDTLSIREGHPVVNGVEKSDEAYTYPCGIAFACNLPRPIRVPPGHYFVMGDNRGGSLDSRYWGPIPRDWIVGKAFATYWPPSRLGIF
jgi:signal peptidase I